MAASGRTLPGRIRHWYGANPLHLLAMLAAFALAGYAVRAVIAAGQFRGFAIWFAVAIIGHDLLLFPLYSLADLSVQRLLPWWASRKRAARRRTPHPVPGPPLINYVRIPVAFSLLLLLTFFPLILGLSEPEYHRASGLTTQPYLWRWLAVTGVLFAASAVIYALRWRRASARARKQAARTRTQQPPHTARDAVPVTGSGPPPGFDVWQSGPPRPWPRLPRPSRPYMSKIYCRKLTPGASSAIPSQVGISEDASAIHDHGLRPPPGQDRLPRHGRAADGAGTRSSPSCRSRGDAARPWPPMHQPFGSDGVAQPAAAATPGSSAGVRRIARLRHRASNTSQLSRSRPGSTW